MTIEIWLGIALTCSTALNLFFIWFLVEQSKRLTFVSANMNDLIDMISSYSEHLKKVYGMEMFYGDETLGALMEHTRTLVDILEEEYDDVLSLTELIEYEEIENYEKIEEDTQEENVFYTGSRERNS